MKKNNNLTKKIARKMCATGAGFLLATAPTLASCESDGVINYALKADATDFLEDKIDYSNIDLRKQPLRVIRQAVEGEWRIVRYGWGQPRPFQNAFVTITSDSVIIKKDEAEPKNNVYLLPSSFSYRWEIRNVGGERRYLMMHNDVEYCPWFRPYTIWGFQFIQNDTTPGYAVPSMRGNLYSNLPTGEIGGPVGGYFIFWKIKE